MAVELSRLQGIFVPMLTPFDADERVDLASLRRLVDFLIEAGVHGLWAMGTTGEFAAVPASERVRAIEATLDQANGRVPVVVNVADGSTRLAIEHAKQAVQLGAQALAVTPPYYYPHTMDEMLAHFRTVKSAHPDVPLLVYNIPQTVKVRMSVPTTLQLAREGAVQGIKDSQNDLRWFRSLVQGIRADGLEDSFRLFLGTRTLIDAGAVIGAHGAIPATSNVAPAACAEAWESAARGDFRTAEQAIEVVGQYEELATLARGGSPEAGSFASMKTALVQWGIFETARLSLPLRSFGEEERAAVGARLAAMPHGSRRVAVAA
jgi:4-hydroxy-tetrahydrodipicolinate synthase